MNLYKPEKPESTRLNDYPFGRDPPAFSDNVIARSAMILLVSPCLDFAERGICFSRLKKERQIPHSDLELSKSYTFSKRSEG